jgi:hypothetical protein
MKNSVILSRSEDQLPATSLITGNVRIKVPFEGEFSQKVGWLVNARLFRGLILRQAQDDGRFFAKFHPILRLPGHGDIGHFPILLARN